jgi:hypothetical protein
VEPTDPAHKPLYEVAKGNQLLERVRELLVPVRWPRTLQLVLKGCDGESNAFYEIAVVRRLLRKSWEYQKLHKNHSLALFRNTPPLAAGILYFVARSL